MIKSAGKALNDGDERINSFEVEKGIFFNKGRIEKSETKRTKSTI